MCRTRMTSASSRPTTTLHLVTPGLSSAVATKPKPARAVPWCRPPSASTQPALSASPATQRVLAPHDRHDCKFLTNLHLVQSNTERSAMGCRERSGPGQPIPLRHSEAQSHPAVNAQLGAVVHGFGWRRSRVQWWWSRLSQCCHTRHYYWNVHHHRDGHLGCHHEDRNCHRDGAIGVRRLRMDITDRSARLGPGFFALKERIETVGRGRGCLQGLLDRLT